MKNALQGWTAKNGIGVVRDHGSVFTGPNKDTLMEWKDLDYFEFEPEIASLATHTGFFTGSIAQNVMVWLWMYHYGKSDKESYNENDWPIVDNTYFSMEFTIEQPQVVFESDETYDYGIESDGEGEGPEDQN